MGGVQERTPFATLAVDPSDIETDSTVQATSPSSVAETALVPAAPAVQEDVFATSSVGVAEEESSVVTESVSAAESSVVS